MDAPDPEGFSLLAKLIAAASAIIFPSWAGWNWLDKTYARKQAVNNEIKDVKDELGVQRGHIGKIFEQMRDAEKIAEARHRELLMHLIEGGKP